MTHSQRCDIDSNQQCFGNNVFRIVVGSCNNQNLTQPLWDVLISRKPVAFVWAGDAIYADKFIRSDWSKFPPGMVEECATPEILRRSYQRQSSHYGYQRFLQDTNATVFGTLDDHDMGCNNADKNFPFKTESALTFLDFTGESHDSPVYKRAKAGHGVYGVKLFDFASNNKNYIVSDRDAAIDPDVVPEWTETTELKYSNQSVAIFYLDVRTHRTPWGKGLQGWKPNYEGDFLGERQWAWLEKAVMRSKASVNIFVQGLQVHPYRFPDANVAEVWAQFPTARQRLYDTILADHIKAPILVSGDVHMAQLMRKDCVKYTDRYNADSPRRPLIEVTTSGMTHSWGTVFFSSERIEKSWKRFYYHFFSNTFMNMVHLLLPMPDLIRSGSHVYTSDRGIKLYENGGGEHSTQGKQFALGLNVGEFEFDWSAQTVTVRVHGVETNAAPLLSAKWTFYQLSGVQKMPGGYSDVSLSEKYGRYQMDTFVDPGRYMCMNHRPPARMFEVAFGYVALTLVMLLLVFGPYMILFKILARLRRMFYVIVKPVKTVD